MTAITGHFTANSTANNRIGGIVKTYLWHWEREEVKVVYEMLGEGKPVLLLPAFSTVSTRGEMLGLAKHLSSQFQVMTLDWPGFGDSARLPFDYNPELYHQFLQDFARDILTSPTTIIAAGHGAGYGIKLAKIIPELVNKIVLVAPTWRGPLPTMGAAREFAGIVRELVRSQILGQILYKLNTAPGFLRWMYKRHVYVDEAKLTPEFIYQKWQITQQPGARYGPAAFVTGGIDPVEKREDFLALFESVTGPILAIIAAQSPPKSRSEMDALAGLPGIETRVLNGTLGLHEEYATELAEFLASFLAASGST